MTTVTDMSELLAALQAATGGETILMEPGDYGRLFLNVNGSQSWATWPTDVTITSADPNNPARFTGNKTISLEAVEHLVFDDIVSHYIPGAGATTISQPLEIEACDYIRFRNCLFDADFTAPGDRVGKAITSDFGSDHVTVDGCTIVDYNNGIFVRHGGAAPKNHTIINNSITQIREDFLHFMNIQGLLVEGNVCKHSRISGGAHADMMQFRSTIHRNQDIVIRGNYFDAGDGEWTQTILMTTEGGIPSDNILIEHNVIHNGDQLGIAAPTGTNITVRHNTLLWHQDAKDATGDSARPFINNITGEPTNSVHNNIAPNRTTSPPGTDNLVLQYDDAQHADYVETLLVNGLAGETAVLADLKAVDGNIIHTSGVGADMTRTGVMHVAPAFGVKKLNVALQLRAAS